MSAARTEQGPREAEIPYEPQCGQGIISVLDAVHRRRQGLLTLIVVRLTDTIVDFVSFAPTFYEQSVLPGITKLYNWVLEVGERFDVSIMDAIEQALPGMISNLGSAVTNLSGKIVSGITGIASRLAEHIAQQHHLPDRHGLYFRGL